MANWYVNSAASGTGVGTTWVNAAVSISALLALGTKPVAGDTIFILNTSNETYGTATNLNPLNNTSIYSATNAHEPPLAADLTAGAQISCTGNLSLNATSDINIYLNGLVFNMTTGNLTMSGGNGNVTVADNCTFNLANGANSFNVSTGNGAIARLLGCTINCANVGNFLGAANAELKNCSVTGVAPTIFHNPLGSGCYILFEGCDLSLMGAGKTLFGGWNGIRTSSKVYAKDCKIAAAATVVSAQTGWLDYYNEVNLTRTDSSGTINQFARYTKSGTETRSTTVYRTGGAIDQASAGFGKNIVTTSTILPFVPFESIPMMEINLATGSAKTVTVYGVWDNAVINTTPNNDDIWIEVEYPKNTADPQGGYANSTKATRLTTASAYAQDNTSTWNGVSGFTHATAWTMSVSITPRLAGPIIVRLFVAKASATFYVDPAPVIT